MNTEAIIAEAAVTAAVESSVAAAIEESTDMTDELADLNDLDLDDLDMEAAGEEAAEDVIEDVIEDQPEAETHDLEPGEASALDASVAKLEAYEDQDASDADLEASEKTAEAATAATTPVKPVRVGKPRIERDLSALPDTAFEIITGTPSVKADVIAKRPAQKKIADKFDDLIVSVNAGKAPSRYTAMLFKTLDAKVTATNADLMAALVTEGKRGGTENLGNGTAASQVGQIMVLFDTLGIAKRSGKTLTMNTDSAIAAKLRTILA